MRLIISSTIILSGILACSNSDTQTEVTDPQPSTQGPDNTPDPIEQIEPIEADTQPQPSAVEAATDALPDVSSNLQSGRCENGPGAEGADSYFSGEFTVAGNTVTGTETWTLFANEKWKEKGGLDCSITWSISGSVSGTGACSTCSQGVQFHATADVDGSNCPDELVQGRLLPDGRRAGGEGVDFDNSYAIENGADGAIKIYFAQSGRLLGEGYMQGERFNYVSDHQCKWF